MPSIADKIWIARQVFETWWIRIPPDFRETYVEQDQYRHAHDDRRSVSPTSTVVAEQGRPVPADALARQVLSAIHGDHDDRATGDRIARTLGDAGD